MSKLSDAIKKNREEQARGVYHSPAPTLPGLNFGGDIELPTTDDGRNPSKLTQAIIKARTGATMTNGHWDDEPNVFNGGLLPQLPDVTKLAAAKPAVSKTSLDYSQDEGIFTWNGKSYGSYDKLRGDIDRAGLSGSDLEALNKKLAMYGFDENYTGGDPSAAAGKSGSRVGNTVRGGLKAEGSRLANSMASLYSMGQDQRTRENQEALDQLNWELERAQRAYEEDVAAFGADSPDVQSDLYIIEDITRRRDAYAEILGNNVQERATQATFDLATEAALSAQQDIANAKDGLGVVGQKAVDFGAGLLPIAGQIGANILAPGVGTVGRMMSLGGGAVENYKTVAGEDFDPKVAARINLGVGAGGVAAGKAISAGIGAAGLKLLRNMGQTQSGVITNGGNGLVNNVLANIMLGGAKAVGYAAGETGAMELSKAATDEDYTPDWGQIASGFAMAFAFGALSEAISTIKITQANKTAMQQRADALEQNYQVWQRIMESETDPAVRMDAAAQYNAAANEFLQYLDSVHAVGAQAEINSIRNFVYSSMLDMDAVMASGNVASAATPTTGGPLLLGDMGQTAVPVDTAMVGGVAVTNPVDVAIEALQNGGTVTNSMAEAVLADPQAVATLAQTGGLAVSDDMTMSELRGAVKGAVAVAAGRVGTDTPAAVETPQAGLQAVQTGNVERSDAIMVQDMQSVADFGATLGKAGETALVALYDPYSAAAADYLPAALSAYQAGQNGTPLDQVDTNTALTPQQREAMHMAGQADAERAVDSGKTMAYNNANKNIGTEGMNDEQGLRVRESGQRDNGAYPGGEVRAVAGNAGQDQGGRVQARPADGGTAGLSYGQEVSAADIGAPGGSTAKALRVVTGGDTEYTKAARAIANERGLELTLFSGGNLELTQNGKPISAGAFISGKRAWVRVDHQEYTADQFMRHEAGHDMIDSGEINPDDTRSRLEKMVGREGVQRYADMYALAYSGSDLSPAEIWDECICDSLGDMNIFSGTRFEAEAAEYGAATKQAAQADRASRSGRGPPDEAEGHASRATATFLKHFTGRVRDDTVFELTPTELATISSNIKSGMARFDKSATRGLVTAHDNRREYTYLFRTNSDRSVTVVDVFNPDADKEYIDHLDEEMTEYGNAARSGNRKTPGRQGYQPRSVGNDGGDHARTGQSGGVQSMDGGTSAGDQKANHGRGRRDSADGGADQAPVSGKGHASQELEGVQKLRDEDRALAPAFYSKAERIVEGMKQDKFGASSVTSMLTGRGVKAEELKWLGLDTWLAGKKSVTKDELLGFIRDNSLQVTEDWLTDKEIPWSKEHTDKIAEYSEQHGEVMDLLAAEWQRATGTEFRLPREANIDRHTIQRDLLELRSRAVSESDVGKRRDELKESVKQIIVDNDNFLFDRPGMALLSIIHDAEGFISRMDVDPEDAAVIREFAEAHEAAKELNASVAPLSEAETNRLLRLADEAHGWSVKITDVKSEHYAENAKKTAKWGRYKVYGGENYREVLYRMPGSDYTNSAMQTHWDDRTGVLAHARMQDFQTEHGKVLFIDEIQSDWHNAGHSNGYYNAKDAIKVSIGEYRMQSNGVPIAEVRDGNDNLAGYIMQRDGRYYAESSNGMSLYWHDTEAMAVKAIEDHENDVSFGEQAPVAPFKDSYTDFVLKNLLRTAAEDGYAGIAWTTAAMQSERWSEQYAEGYRIEYDQQIPGFLKKYGKQWGASVSEITLNEGDDAVTVPYMAVTDSMRESVLYEGQPKFSRESTSLEELKVEAQRVKLTANRLAKQAEYWRGQTKLTTPETRSLRQGDVNKLARQLIEENRSTAKFKDVRDMLTDLGEYLLRGEPDSGEIISSVVYEKSIDIATELVENAVMPDEFANIRSYVKSTKLTISAQDKADITDFNDWRKRNFGKIHLVNEGGVPVDAAYMELQEMAPGLFPEDITHPADQLRHIVETLDSLDNIRTMYSFEAEEAVTYVADQVLDGIMSEDVRQTPPTYADRQAAKLAQTKAKAAQAIQAERAKRYTAVENIKRHYAERDKRIAERRADTKARTRLLNIVRRLNNRKLPAVNRALIDEYIGDIDTFAKSITGQTVQKLEDLQQWYYDKTHEGSTIYDPDFLPDKYIEERLARLSKRHIADMTSDEVAELTEALLNIENELRTSKKLIDTEDRREVAMMGREVVAHVEGSVGSKKGIKDATVNGVLTPERQARRITGYDDNDPLYKACVSLSDGQRKAMDYEMRSGKGFEKWTTDKTFCKNFSGQKAKAITITGQGSDGPVTVKITPAMRVALYMHSLNSDNLLHIKEGGVTIPDWDYYVKGDLAEAYARGTTIKLTPSAVQGIVAGMTEQERAFAQAMRRYFNEQSQPEINATSEKLKGYSIAQVENYFPINVNRNYSRSEMETVLQDTSIEGMGFLKERVSGRNPILLRDADLVLQQSIKQHGKYVGLAIPVRNFNKLWNVTITNWDEDGNRVSFDNSVKAAVASRWGEAGVSYMEKMVADLQGGTVKTPDFFGKKLAAGRSNYAGAVLTLNASVAIKQAASYPTAAAVLGWGPLVKAFDFKGKVDEALIAKYTPLLWYRTQGFSTQELGDMTSRGQSMPKALNWIQGMDLATTRTLWKASEYYVKDKSKDLQPGTDEFYREVARVYNRVIEETQPNYTTMQRGGVLRSDNELVKSLNMFKTQPFQNMNILYDAYGKLAAETRRYKSGTGSKEAYREAKGNFAKAVSSQIVSAFVFALMQYGWDAFRGKDKKYRNKDGDYTFGSWAKGMGINMATNGFGMVPFGSEVWEFGTSIVDAFQEGRDADPIFDSTFYGLDVSILESITDTGKDIVSLVKSLGSIFDGSKDWEDLARRAYSTGEDVLELKGKPLGNLKNMGVAIARWALIGSKGPILGEYKALGIVYQPGSTKWKQQAYDLLFKAKNEDPAVYDVMYADMQKHGVSEDAIKAAMKQRTKASAAFEEARSGYLQQATASFDGFATFGQYKDEAQKTAQDKANELAADYAAQKAMLATDPGYALPQTFSWIEKADGGADVGLDPSEYILYRAALEITDDGNNSITNLECEAAIRMLTGLSDEERDYLWHSQGKKDKNKPKW